MRLRHLLAVVGRPSRRARRPGRTGRPGTRPAPGRRTSRGAGRPGRCRRPGRRSRRRGARARSPCTRCASRAARARRGCPTTARPSRSPRHRSSRAGPSCPARSGSPPRSAKTREHGLAVPAGDVAEGRVGGDGEVEVGPRPGRRRRRPGAAGQVDDQRDRLDGTDVVVGRQHPQRLHVVAEQLGLALGQLDPVDADLGGPLEQRVVDVGDVLDVGDLVPGVAPRPVEQVEGDVRRGVAEVGGVVRRDPADVEPGRALGAGLDELAGRGVVQAHGGPGDGRGRDVGRGPGAHAGKPIRGRDAAQKGGQGMTGHAPCGLGQRPGAQQPLGSGARVASTSVGRRAAPRAAPPARRASASSTRSTPAISSSVQRLAGPAPQDRAQLVLDVEGHPVVDAVAVAVGHRQHVPALAVGVVDHDVEDRHPAQRVGVLVDQRDRPVVARRGRRRRGGSPRAPRPRAPGRRRPAPGRARATAAPCPARAARRAGSSAARRPSRGPRTRRTPRPRAPASVPSGKSHSGRSPRDRLVDAPHARRSRRRRWRWRRA